MPSGVDPSTAPIEAIFAGVVDGTAYVVLPNLPNRRTPVEGVLGGAIPAVDERVLVTYADTGRIWLVRGGDVASQAELDATQTGLVTTQAALNAHVALTSTAHVIPVVAALPGAPVNGQEVIYQNAAMLAQGAAWRLKYIAATAGAFKWTFMGGSRYAVYTAAGAASVTSVDFWADFTATVQGTITFPLAGWYVVKVDAGVNGTPNAAFIWQLGFQKNPGGVNATFGLPGIGAASQGGSSFALTYTHTIQELQAAAGDTLRLIYWSINVGFNIANSKIFIEPIIVG